MYLSLCDSPGNKGSFSGSGVSNMESQLSLPSFHSLFSARFSGNPVERSALESSPGGAIELSPALQRWGQWEKRFKSRRKDRVLVDARRRFLLPSCTDLLANDLLRRGTKIAIGTKRTVIPDLRGEFSLRDSV